MGIAIAIGIFGLRHHSHGGALIAKDDPVAPSPFAGAIYDAAPSASARPQQDPTPNKRPGAPYSAGPAARPGADPDDLLVDLSALTPIAGQAVTPVSTDLAPSNSQSPAIYPAVSNNAPPIFSRTPAMRLASAPQPPGGGIGPPPFIPTQPIFSPAPPISGPTGNAKPSSTTHNPPSSLPIATPHTTQNPSVPVPMLVSAPGSSPPPVSPPHVTLLPASNTPFRPLVVSADAGVPSSSPTAPGSIGPNGPLELSVPTCPGCTTDPSTFYDPLVVAGDPTLDPAAGINPVDPPLTEEVQLQLISEPGTLALLGSGLFALGLRRHWQRRTREDDLRLLAKREGENAA